MPSHVMNEDDAWTPMNTRSKKLLHAHVRATLVLQPDGRHISKPLVVRFKLLCAATEVSKELLAKAFPPAAILVNIEERICRARSVCWARSRMVTLAPFIWECVHSKKPPFDLPSQA